MKREPKAYLQRQGARWWLHNTRYFGYALRETAGLFMAVYVFIFIYQLAQVKAGLTAYEAFRGLAASPALIVLSTITMVLTLLHSVTWFQLTAKIQKLMMKGKGPPNAAFLAANIIVLLVASYLVYLLIW